MATQRARRTRPDPKATPPLADSVARFGAAVTAKLMTGVGSEEDHVRAAFEALVSEASALFGFETVFIGESRLPELGIRPDYAINVDGSRVGYVELKKPGSGTPETWSARTRNIEQWNKLSLLPNVLFSDGENFACYRSGELLGKIARLNPSLRRAGERLHVTEGSMEDVLFNFLSWQPEHPRSIKQLVSSVARLCALLREEVEEILEQEAVGAVRPARFSTLAHEWRGLLFPNLTDKEFADAYAQTVTFALLLARVEGVAFAEKSVDQIALLLRKKHALMGRALGVLVDASAPASIAIESMMKIVGVVDFDAFGRDVYIELFEDFLQTYDPAQRRRTGSYYTPDAVVSSMVDFADDILKKKLDRCKGFATDDVIVVDPAMGTGSFLARAIDKAAETVAEEEGIGQVAPRMRSLSRRLIGFEKQTAPYAVALLRLHALLRNSYMADLPEGEYRFLTDALDNPNLQQLGFGSVYDEIQASWTGANRVKREVPVMVVIGNPPYRERAKGMAPWVEDRGGDLTERPSLDAFRSPGNGRFEYVLSNLYVYFWRWSTWKVFDTKHAPGVGMVSLITPSSFMTGPGFRGMREYLRRTADEGWVVDLSPEGHQAPVNTRIFPGTQHPLCIALFLRRGPSKSELPARIHYRAIRGTQVEKFQQLRDLSISDPEWQDCGSGWGDPLTPGADALWDTYPKLTELMPWSIAGMKPNRTWVYSPNSEDLMERWSRLTHAPRGSQGSLFKETDTRRIDSPPVSLPGAEFSPRQSIAAETGECPPLKRVAFRPFDRQWCIADARVLDRPRPDLWSTVSDQQVFVTEQHAEPVHSGPGLLFSSCLPDMHHFNGRGGRVFPFFRDATAQETNVVKGMISFLQARLGIRITPQDILAYVAAIASHPGYTQKFAGELSGGGVRIPITIDQLLWKSAVDIGREVIWLHTYGERFRGPSRPRGIPRMPTAARPKVIKAIPYSTDEMPQTIDYSDLEHGLVIGGGIIAPVSWEVWNFRVCDWYVVRRWFAYRRQGGLRGSQGLELDGIRSREWTAEMTGELLDLLNVLGRCTLLHPRQTELLNEIVSGPTLALEELGAGGLLPVMSAKYRPMTPSSGGGLFAV